MASTHGSSWSCHINMIMIMLIVAMVIVVIAMVMVHNNYHGI